MIKEDTFFDRTQDLKPWFHNGLFVKESSIDGVGVFSATAIQDGEVLIRFGGFLVHPEDVLHERAVRSTSIGLSEYVSICEMVGWPKDLSDHLNHSCDPNTGFLDALTLVATRNVDRDEEITVDYAYWEGDQTWVLKRQCDCKSGNCRRTISGKDWQDLTIASRLVKHASPFIRRRIFHYPGFKQP
jgi:hypothetical protein